MALRGGGGREGREGGTTQWGIIPTSQSPIPACSRLTLLPGIPKRAQSFSDLVVRDDFGFWDCGLEGARRGSASYPRDRVATAYFSPSLKAMHLGIKISVTGN